MIFIPLPIEALALWQYYNSPIIIEPFPSGNDSFLHGEYFICVSSMTSYNTFYQFACLLSFGHNHLNCPVIVLCDVQIYFFIILKCA